VERDHDRSDAVLGGEAIDRLRRLHLRNRVGDDPEKSRGAINLEHRAFA
jgi:hypothetical protein